MHTDRIPCSSIKSQNEMQVRIDKSKTYVFKTGEKKYESKNKQMF